MEMASNLQVRGRAYRESDAGALVALWKTVYRKYGGYVPRTDSYWNWFVLNRPGVSVDDVLLIHEGGGILGYAVLAPNGYVLEMAIEPTLPLRRRSEIAAMLCDALENRAKAKGITRIDIAVPGDDQAVSETLRALDYAEATGDFFNMTIMNPVGLIQRVLEHRRKSIPQNWAKTFLLEFANGNYRFNPFPKVFVQIGNDLTVTPVTTEQPTDCRVKISLSTFTELIFNRLTFQSAIESEMVTVTPHSEFHDAQLLFSLITIRAPWYSPLADRR
jgi:ribosomal protein S18 acetylase RimI-like enzyme